MKRGLLSLQPLYQILDPVKHWLIGDAGRHETVMFDLLVDLNACSHMGRPLQAGMPTGHLWERLQRPGHLVPTIAAPNGGWRGKRGTLVAERGRPY
jgi:hypothetical protein